MMSSSSSSRESRFGGRVGMGMGMGMGMGSLHHHLHRRGHSFNPYSNSNSNSNSNSDDNLDLFFNKRLTLSVASSDESSDVSVKLERLLGSAKLARSEMDDLLSSTEGGKHDYDWLLTPPGTPDVPSSEGESQPTSLPPGSSLSRSTSATNTSKLSVSQSENNSHTRPARSSSVIHYSISSSQYSTYSSNKSSSILNTSFASVSSYTRPSSPITRSPSAAGPPTPSSRPTASRPSTPTKIRSVPTSSSADKSRASTISRPSTPSSGSRPHIPANLHSPSTPSARSLSRPSTPTRRNSMPSPSPAATTPSSTSTGRRNSASVLSRPSSPGPRPRASPQLVVPPDFPLETPPNLRTTLPDRPVSAGRSRPGVATLKGSSETQASINMPRRPSSPIVNRGRLIESTAKSRGHHADVPEPWRVPHAPEVVARKSVKASTATTDNPGFGRSISKKSLDVAIRHMDIKSNSGHLRSLSSTTLYPQSVRTSASKTQSNQGLGSSVFVDMNGSLQNSNNGASFGFGNDINRMNTRGIDERQYFAKLNEVDIYESCRYDALLLKEDLKNTSWLRSADDKSDQGPIFDNGFDPLPEPFGLF